MSSSEQTSSAQVDARGRTTVQHTGGSAASTASDSMAVSSGQNTTAVSNQPFDEAVELSKSEDNAPSSNRNRGAGDAGRGNDARGGRGAADAVAITPASEELRGKLDPFGEWAYAALNQGDGLDSRGRAYFEQHRSNIEAALADALRVVVRIEDSAGDGERSADPVGHMADLMRKRRQGSSPLSDDVPRPSAGSSDASAATMLEDLKEVLRMSCCCGLVATARGLARRLGGSRGNLVPLKMDAAAKQAAHGAHGAPPPSAPGSAGEARLGMAVTAAPPPQAPQADFEKDQMASMTDALTWDRTATFYVYGLLVPPRPNQDELAASKTPLGPLRKLRGLVIQKGPFESIFIRAGCYEHPWVELWTTLKRVVAYYIDTEKERVSQENTKYNAGTVTKKPKPRAIYVAVSLHTMQAIDFGYLVGQGFRFHHHRAPGHGATPLPAPSEPLGDGEVNHRAAKEAASSELVYVAEPAVSLGIGVKGMVPSYSTSIEGATAICLSPDGTKVLLVWERLCWTTPGGAVDPGECKVEALRRELMELLGAELDENAEMQYVGGWSKGRARDNISNDSFSCFVVHVKSEHLQVDNLEIQEADWFEWKPLLAKWREMDEPRGYQLEIDVGKGEGRSKMGGNTLLGLDLYEKGKGCKLKTKKTQQGPHSVMKAYWGSELGGMRPTKAW